MINKKAAPRRQAVAKPYQRNLARQENVRELINELLELEQLTRPDGGDLTAADKDKRAVRALRVSSDLVSSLAGWAINHQLGLAINGQSSVRPTIEPVKGLRLLSKAAAKVDNHKHEIAGARFRPHSSASKTLRRALVNLLLAGSGGFGVILSAQTVDALRALEYNEILPILRPEKNKRKVSYSELQTQLRAISIVEHRAASGMKRYEALGTVADALGVGTHTVRSWKKRLCREFGSLHVETELTSARQAKKGHSFLYGEHALTRIAKTYRELQKK